MCVMSRSRHHYQNGIFFVGANNLTTVYTKPESLNLRTKSGPEHLLVLENVVQVRYPVRIERSHGGFGDIFTFEGFNEASGGQSDTDGVVATFRGGNDPTLDLTAYPVHDIPVEAGRVLGVHSGAGLLTPALLEDGAELEAVEAACNEDDVGTELLQDGESDAFKSGQYFGVPVGLAEGDVYRVPFSSRFFYDFSKYSSDVAVMVGAWHDFFGDIVSLRSVGLEPAVPMKRNVENGFGVSENELCSVSCVNVQVENSDADRSVVGELECRIVDLQKPLERHG